MEHISETIARIINRKQIDTQERTNRSIAEGIVEGTIGEVERTIRNQQAKVLASGKYPNPVHQSNHTMHEWVKHQREELADSLIYLQCIDETNEEVIEMLGAVIQYIDQGQHGTARQALIYAIHRLGGGGESK